MTIYDLMPLVPDSIRRGRSREEDFEAVLCDYLDSVVDPDIVDAFEKACFKSWENIHQKINNLALYVKDAQHIDQEQLAKKLGDLYTLSEKLGDIINKGVSI